MKFSLKNLNVWHLYLVIFGFFTINRTIQLYNSDGIIYKYYNMLLGLKIYHIYIAQQLQNILELLSLIPLFQFTFNKTNNLQNFWKCIWVLRILANLFSHSYDLKIIGMYSSDNFLAGILSALQLTTMYLPSFIACYSFAFKSNKKN